MLKSEWFENKRVLDIGCHTGDMTLLVTLKFNPELIIGVDIDHKLISGAIKQMHKVSNEHQTSKLIGEFLNNTQTDLPEETKESKEEIEDILKRIKHLPISLQKNLGPNSILQSMSSENLDDHISKMTKNYLYDRVCFRSENYISNLDTSYEKFDTIMCLGTVKWIHLNFGDVGLTAMFHKAFESLTSGGFFLLEAQPWKGYKKKKNLSKVLSQNFVEIKLRPNNFDLYLTQSVGFTFVEKLINSEQVLDFTNSNQDEDEPAQKTIN